jgi:hypothetical protein
MLRFLLPLALLASVVLLTGAVLLRLVGDARADRDAARSAQARAMQEVAELAAAAAGPELVATRQRPDQDLVAALQDALKAQGLPLTAFAGVKPRGDSRLGGDASHGDSRSAVRVQQVQVSLTGLAPLELGAFLGGLASAGSPWRLAELQLVHARLASGPASEPTAEVDRNRYDATLLLAAPYLDLPALAAGPVSEPGP